MNNVDPSGHLVTPGPDGKLVMVHGIGFPPDTSYKEESWLYDVADYFNLDFGIETPIHTITRKGYEIVLSAGIGYVLGSIGAITISSGQVSTRYGVYNLGVGFNQTTTGLSLDIGRYTWSVYTRHTLIDSWFGVSATYSPVSGPYVMLKIEWTYNRLYAMAVRAKIAAMVINPTSVVPQGAAKGIKLLLKKALELALGQTPEMVPGRT